MHSTLRLGTRGSRLALWQAHRVRALLTDLPDAPAVEIVEISTSGDRIQDVALSSVPGRDFFTKDIEDALLEDRIDLAVHSLKDLATVQPDGLGVGAVLERADPRDALVAPPGTTVDSLPGGAVVGTSSLRRKAFLAARRPDLVTRELRGNVPTRVQRWRDGEYDALLLASAGLDRLEIGEVIAERIDPDTLAPAPAQGAVAVQTRVDDEATLVWIRQIDHADTAVATRAERALLNFLEGGCQVPVGALATLEAGRLSIHAAVASLDGTEFLAHRGHGTLANPEQAGREVARELVDRGARRILDEIRNASAR